MLSAETSVSVQSRGDHIQAGGEHSQGVHIREFKHKHIGFAARRRFLLVAAEPPDCELSAFTIDPLICT
jgi:hypothetical protein